MSSIFHEGEQGQCNGIIYFNDKCGYLQKIDSSNTSDDKKHFNTAIHKDDNNLGVKFVKI